MGFLVVVMFIDPFVVDFTYIRKIQDKHQMKWVLVINQQDVTFIISLFILYMFRTILVHHQEFYFVWHAGLTLSVPNKIPSVIRVTLVASKVLTHMCHRITYIYMMLKFLALQGVVCLKCSVNGTRKQTKQKIQIH
jgi:hypothetical protein